MVKFSLSHFMWSDSTGERSLYNYTKGHFGISHFAQYNYREVVFFLEV